MAGASALAASNTALTPTPLTLTVIPNEVLRAIFKWCFKGSSLSHSHHLGQNTEHTATDHYAVLLTCKHVYICGIDLYYNLTIVHVDQYGLDYCSSRTVQQQSLQHIIYHKGGFDPRRPRSNLTAAQHLNRFPNSKTIQIQAKLTLKDFKPEDEDDDKIITRVLTREGTFASAHEILNARPTLRLSFDLTLRGTDGELACVAVAQQLGGFQLTRKIFHAYPEDDGQSAWSARSIAAYRQLEESVHQSIREYRNMRAEAASDSDSDSTAEYEGDDADFQL